MRQLREVWGVRLYTSGVIARLDRAIQYAEAVVVERTGRGVLDAPVKPGHDSGVRSDSSVCPAAGPPQIALTFAQIAIT